MPTILLTRDNFREAIFKRDGHKCVICKNDAVDAHHIIERRLWSDGGYYVDNGASVCSSCHLLAESTDISVEQLREAAQIKKILPEHMYSDEVYDKWGNIVLPNGQRLRGELFYDESVQKILASKLHLFTEYVKYPRTHHLPWSDGMHDDDRMIDNMNHFIGQRIIVTEKMDGENTTMYSDYIHARSIDGRHHQSRNWVKGFWGTIKSEIPTGYRICGENLYAKHSIGYSGLLTYFMGFSVWTNKNICLDWDTTLEWFGLLGITPVPVLYDGIYDEKMLRQLAKNIDVTSSEGYVVRIASSFGYGEFKTKVVKFVRKDHIRTVNHWMHGQPVTKNQLVTG